MSAWEVPMLLGGALFVGGVTWFAWMRLPVWRTMPRAEFERDFAGSIRRADRVQPALLVVTVIAAVGFWLEVAGASRALASAGIAVLLVVLVGSGGYLVPLQRRIIGSSNAAAREIDAMQRRWSAGHLVRTALALVSFTLLVLAAAR